MSNKGKSGYARHGKAPFRYSDEYHAWNRAVERFGHDSLEAADADAAFRRRFNVPLIAGDVHADY